MPKTKLNVLIRSLVATAFALFAGLPVAAQESMPNLSAPAGMAVQSLRPYWHVFIAYTIVILVVFGWVVSISRRLKDVERRLGG